MGILDRVREQQALRKAAGERKQLVAAEQARAAEAQRQAAAEQAQQDRARMILGADLFDMEVTTPEEAKIAIKLARLRKKEIQTEKRELAAELADVREEWRNRTAGRVSTVGFGRGKGGRMVRGAVQAKRRNERMDHAGVVNQYSDRRQELDAQIATVDRFLIELERLALKS